MSPDVFNAETDPQWGHLSRGPRNIVSQNVMLEDGKPHRDIQKNATIQRKSSSAPKIDLLSVGGYVT